MFTRLYKPLIKLSFAISLLLIADTAALAQSSGATSGTITGVIKDSQGAVISNAVISIEKEDTNLVFSTNSSNSGVYQATQLPPGTYKLSVTSTGFSTATTTLILTVGTTALVDIELEPGNTSDFITVNSETLATVRTESSTNITGEKISSLPINQRNYLDFTLTVARAVMDRIPPNGTTATSGISFNGQTARGNNFTIDGISNNDIPNGAVRTTFSQEAIQEFQVVSDGYSAEFGRAIGGIINIVTKTGSNDFHGSVFGFFRNNKISAREVFTAKKVPFRQYQNGFTFSGPLKKDKAFFFISFERLSVKQNTIVSISDQVVASARRQGYPLSNGAIPFSIGNSLVLARSDINLSPFNRLAVRFNGGYKYNGSFETGGDVLGGFVSETSSGIQRLDDYSFAANNIYTNTNLNFVNEARFLYGRLTQKVDPVDVNNPATQLITDQGRAIFGRNIVLPQPSDGRFFQLVDTVSLIRDRHQIKFGGDFSFFNTIGDKTDLQLLKGGLAVFAPIDFAQASGIPGLPFFDGLATFDPTVRSSVQNNFLTAFSGLLPGLFPGFPANLPLTSLALPAVFIQGFGNSNVSTQTKLFSTFIQDDFRLKENLLVKLGLRYDFSRVTAIPNNNGNFSPRIAIAFSPQKFPKLQIRANYGIFFGSPVVANGVTATLFRNSYKVVVFPFPFSIIPFSLPNHRFADSQNISSTVPFIAQLSQTFNFQPDYSNAYTQQAGLSSYYRLNNNTAIELSYIYVRGAKLTGSRNINPIVRPIANDPMTSAIIGRNDPSQGDIIQFQSAFDSYYHAGTISLERRLIKNFNFLASYTFSKSIDNVVDGIRPDIQPPNNPLKPGDERSLSLQDLRHRFVASATVDFNDSRYKILRDFQVSTIITLESGHPYNLLAGIDLDQNGDNPAGDRPNGISRNAGITPGFYNVNFRLTRSLQISEKYRLQGFLEVFNLFNTVNINQVNNVFFPDAQGNFNLPRQENGRFVAPREGFQSAFAPRQFQLGFRFNF